MRFWRGSPHCSAIVRLRWTCYDELGESATIGQYPEGVEAVQLACTSAAVYGFLGDAEAMMPFARRCFTSVNGYPIAYLNDPEFAWRKNDPRMKALAARQIGR